MTQLPEHLTPERWLEICHAELQNTFLTFDGYMMVSAVFGLLDDETGVMYYINAEHPYVALYREGRASFVENDLSLRKLGVEGFEDELRVKILQLQRDDIVIIGSDGRDDIHIGMDKNGNRIINEDETMFLRHVERGSGDLQGIEESILKSGELTDDLTLMRIGYKEDFPALVDDPPPELAEHLNQAHLALQEKEYEAALVAFAKAHALSPNDPEIISQLARLCIVTKEFRKAAEYCESYVSLNPGDTKFFLYTAKVFKQLGNLKKAADYSERYRLREPSAPENLFLLADIYRQMKMPERAWKFLQQGLRIAPEHKWGLRLSQKMGSSK